MLNCGYPVWAFIKSDKKNNWSKGSGTSQPATARATIPNVAGISEKIKNSFKSHGVAISFKLPNTLQSKLVEVMQVKEKTPKEKRFNLVFGLACSEDGCQETYVDETKQSVKARLQQHRRPSTNEAQNSAVFKHIKGSEYNIEYHDIIINDREEQWYKRGIKEAVCEKKMSNLC